MKKGTMLLLAGLVAAVSQTAVAQHSQHALAPQSDRQQLTQDQLRIAVQEICPVSGQKLGSMGTPVKVKIGEEFLFLCCKGCAGGKVKPEHWATIHANFAKAQGKCPVMEHPLPDKPKWTIVEGRIVFVCCPPCIEKIKADPTTYLKKVDKLYSAHLQAEKSRK